MCPFVGCSNPRINFTVVDLPEPFGPSNPNTSPRRTSKSALSTARALGRPQKSLKTLVSPRTETITSPSEHAGMSVVVMLMQIASDFELRTPIAVGLKTLKLGVSHANFGASSAFGPGAAGRSGPGATGPG